MKSKEGKEGKPQRILPPPPHDNPGSIGRWGKSLPTEGLPRKRSRPESKKGKSLPTEGLPRKRSRPESKKEREYVDFFQLLGFTIEERLKPSTSTKPERDDGFLIEARQTPFKGKKEETVPVPFPFPIGKLPAPAQYNCEDCKGVTASFGLESEGYQRRWCKGCSIAHGGEYCIKKKQKEKRKTKAVQELNQRKTKEKARKKTTALPTPSTTVTPTGRDLGANATKTSSTPETPAKEGVQPVLPSGPPVSSSGPPVSSAAPSVQAAPSVVPVVASSKYPGITFNKNGKWDGTTMIDGKHVSYGCFKSEHNAARAHDIFLLSRKIDKNLFLEDSARVWDSIQFNILPPTSTTTCVPAVAAVVKSPAPVTQKVVTEVQTVVPSPPPRPVLKSTLKKNGGQTTNITATPTTVPITIRREGDSIGRHGGGTTPLVTNAEGEPERGISATSVDV